MIMRIKPKLGSSVHKIHQSHFELRGRSQTDELSRLEKYVNHDIHTHKLVTEGIARMAMKPLHRL